MLFRSENNVPDYYVDQSRDFQLLCRLYDLALQSSRYSINSLSTVSDTRLCNDSILPLIGTKVGFFDNLNTVDDATRKVLSCFPYIIQFKGSKKALEMIANLFGAITNSIVEIEEDIINRQFILLFSTPLKDTSLFYQLIEYVRPAGYVIRYDVKTKVEPDDILYTTDTVHIGSKISANKQSGYSRVLKNGLREYQETDDVVISMSWKDEGAVGFTQITGTQEHVQQEED